MNYESLHNHTTSSDGKMTHLEVLASAEKYGFSVIAFTDHDVLPNEKQLKELQEYSGSVKWITGIEISSALPVELGGNPISSFHILGLFVDPFNEALLEHSRLAVNARKKRMEKMVKNLQKLGFDINTEHCKKESGDGSVGRPHIISALLKKEKNIKIIEQIRDNMKEASLSNPKIKERYDDMLEHVKQRGFIAYVFELFMKEDSFIPGIYVDYLYSIDMDKSVELIRNAGGIAILAHWGTIEKKINLEMLESFLREGRLDGVEVLSYFRMDKEYIRKLENVVKRTSAIRTAGVDMHKEADFLNFTNNTELSVKTTGITKEIISKHKLSLTHSNLQEVDSILG